MVKKESNVLGVFLVSLLIVASISTIFVFFDGGDVLSGLATKIKSTAESKVKLTGIYMDQKTDYLATVIKSEGKKTLITSPTKSNAATKGSLSVYYPKTSLQTTVILPNGEKKTVIGGIKNKKGEPTGGAEIKQDKTGKIISVKDKKGYSINQEKNKDKVVVLDPTGSFYVGAGLNGKEIKDYSKLYFKEKEAKEWAEVVAAPSGFFNSLGTLTKSSSSKSKINSLTLEKKWTSLAQEFSAKGATAKEKTFLEKMMGYRKGVDASVQTQDPDCFCSQGSEGESFVDAALGMNPAEGGDLSSATNPGSNCGGQAGGDNMPSGSMMGSGGLGNLGTGSSGKSSGKQSGSSSKSSSDPGCDCTGFSATPVSGKGSLCKGDSASAAIAAAADCIDQGKSNTVVQTGSPMEGTTLENGKLDGEVEVHEGVAHDVYSTGDYYKVTQVNNVKTGASVTMVSSPSSNGETFVQGELINDDINAPIDNPSSYSKTISELMGGSTGHKNLDKLKVTMKDVTKSYYQKAVGPKMESDDVKGADSGTGKAQEDYVLNKLVEFLTGGSGMTGGQCDPDKGPCTSSGSGSGSGGLGGTMITGGDPCETPQITGSLCENSGLYGKIVGMTDPSPIEKTTMTSLASISIDGGNGITCFKGKGNDPKDMVVITASTGGVIMPMAAAKDFASQGGQEK